MDVEDKNIGFALTGAYEVFDNIIPYIKELVKLNANVIPIMSYNTYKLNTKFGRAVDFIHEIEKITKNKVVHTIQEAYLIGFRKRVDIIVIAPCTRKYDIKIGL